jgi:beta-mannanase
VHNLLYAISPSGNKDKLKDTAEYLKISPGKDYVDLYGFDAYAKSNSEALSATRTVVRLATSMGRLRR